MSSLDAFNFLGANYVVNGKMAPAVKQEYRRRMDYLHLMGRSVCFDDYYAVTNLNEAWEDLNSIYTAALTCAEKHDIAFDECRLWKERTLAAADTERMANSQKIKARQEADLADGKVQARAYYLEFNSPENVASRAYWDEERLRRYGPDPFNRLNKNGNV